LPPFLRQIDGGETGGEPAIKRLLISLGVIGAIALGAVWMVFDSAPGVPPPGTEPASRTLAYQQAISEPRPTPAEDEAASGKDVPAFETVTTATPQAPADSIDVAAPPAGADSAQDATLPDESSDLPWQHPGADPQENVAALPGEQPDPYDEQPPPSDFSADHAGTDGAEQWGDEGDYPTPYGEASQPDLMQPDAGQPGQEPTEWADQNTEEWVDVVVSGAAMRSSASEDAPMLFAFPYGRSLKVVSRYEGWVEVTDPKSAATGWMQAHYVAPSAGNQPYAQDQAYYEDEPEQRRGWFRRGGFADMINRAFGGGN
jgi:hypothetical protein